MLGIGDGKFLQTAILEREGKISQLAGTRLQLRRSGTESSLTLRWRGMDSNFQYADAVNLMSPLYAAECSGWVGAPSQHSDSTTPCIKAAWTRPPRPQSVPATHSADFCVVREAVGVGSSKLRYLGAAECSNRRN